MYKGSDYSEVFLLMHWGNQTNSISVISSGSKVFGFYFYHNNLSIHIYTMLLFCHLLHFFPYRLVLFCCFWIMILVIWEARPRTQSSDWSLVCCLHDCYLPSEFLHMLILIRSRSLAVFSNLKVCSIPLFGGHFMLIHFCLASCFPFSLAHFSKPKLAENWKWRLAGIHLSGCPS